jgi:tRNA nucleotidyltransferase (CCA-adding enzyme)
MMWVRSRHQRSRHQQALTPPKKLSRSPTIWADNTHSHFPSNCVAPIAPLTARDILSSPVHGIPADRPLTEARDLLLRYGHGSLRVTGGTAPALVARRDVELAIHHGNGALPVGDYAVGAVTIGPDASLPAIAAALAGQGRVLVVEQDEVIGLISYRDWHRAQATRLHDPELDLPGRLRSALSPALLDLLTQIGQIAMAQNLRPYMVGGVVRDLLRLGPSDRLRLVDVDLVVEGGAVDGGAGRPGAIALAEAIRSHYGAQGIEVLLEIYGKFQTASLTWPADSALGSLGLDLATARSEFYPHPAANPEVEASQIGSDLYRRDFTINAMAIGLSGPSAGQLIDQFGGLGDLRSGLIRVIHPHSLIEDPTRIFRAARFATRLGFDLAPETAQQLTAALASGTYDRVRIESSRIGRSVPSLQTRLRAELETVLSAPAWRSVLVLLDRWGALVCLAPGLRLTATTWLRLRLADRAYGIVNPSGLPRWLLRLEVILVDRVEDPAAIARFLQLPKDSIRRLGLWADRRGLVRGLGDRPSDSYREFQGWDVGSLLLLLDGDRVCRRKVWRYLSDWRWVQPILDGDDLAKLGYKPGKQFKAILNDLLMAQLDGQLAVADRVAAITFVRSRYPIHGPDSWAQSKVSID